MAQENLTRWIPSELVMAADLLSPWKAPNDALPAEVVDTASPSEEAAPDAAAKRPEQTAAAMAR